MARKKTKRQYLAELDRLEPTIRRAYFKWVAGRVGATNVSSVERAIRTGNTASILSGLDLSSSLGDFTESVRDTYKAGGAFEAPAAQVTFNIRSVGAESWIGARSSGLVTNITESQRGAIQGALESGIRNGTNPRTTALDIIGRTNASGKRTGGIVGLTTGQAGSVTSAREQLRSGDPAELRKYLTRERRDKRFDATVRQAIKTGKPIPVAKVNQMTGRYADRLLKLRGETIARTESTAAFNAARNEAWNQAIDAGKVDRNFITKRWSATMDARTRLSHAAMNNQRRPDNLPFNSPTGAQLMYPGDTSMGAGPADVINCRCYMETTVDYIAQAAAQLRVG